MDTSTYEILKECNSGCRMAVNSIEQLVVYLKNQELQELFSKYKEDYEKKEQRLKQSLNGIWKFRYSENAMERPADFYQKWFQCRSFDEMKVPQHIELAGYDKIHYINTMYPWEGHIYRRPAETGKEKRIAIRQLKNKKR